jgi:hypothetical protein
MSIETGGTAQAGLVDTVNEAIRENPLAAGLIGAGVCWMLFGKVKPPALGGIADAMKSAASSVGAAASAGGQSVAAAASRAGAQVAATAGRAGSAVRDELKALQPADVPSIIAEAGETVKAGLRSSANAGQRYGAGIQRTLGENLERQPLLLGAIGLAIGAGIASAFASTRIEGELMGEQGSAAREKLQALAGETKEFAATRTQEVLDAVKDEAQAQGLTPDAARDAVRDVTQKAKGVADTARTAVKDRIS